MDKNKMILLKELIDELNDKKLPEIVEELQKYDIDFTIEEKPIIKEDEEYIKYKREIEKIEARMDKKLEECLHKVNSSRYNMDRAFNDIISKLERANNILKFTMLIILSMMFATLIFTIFLKP